MLRSGSLSISVAVNKYVKLPSASKSEPSSSSTYWSAIGSITGGSFTALTVTVKVLTISSFTPSEAVNSKPSCPL